MTASFTTIYKELDAVATKVAEDMAQMRACKDALQREVYELRKYIDGQMRHHFQSYNGGQKEQFHRFAELRLPLPWVPRGIRGFNDAGAELCGKYDPMFTTVTYVEERRMVPIRDAGRV